MNANLSVSQGRRERDGIKLCHAECLYRTANMAEAGGRTLPLLAQGRTAIVSGLNPSQKERQTFTNISAFELFPTWPEEPKCGAPPGSHHVTTDQARKASVKSAHDIFASIPHRARAGHAARPHAAHVRAAVPALSAALFPAAKLFSLLCSSLIYPSYRLPSPLAEIP